LEAQIPATPNPQVPATRTPATEAITIRTDARQFESFLKSINRCASLLDARRLKNDIVGEIRRTRMLLGTVCFCPHLSCWFDRLACSANHEKDDWIDGEKTEDVVSYLDRLYTAKKKVEQRIVVLGGEDDPVRMAKTFKDLTLTGTLQKPIQSETPTTNGLSLRDVLTTPTSLSYFMEFMDRRNRSLLVQFWLTVESFKNPLEAVDSDSSGEDDDELIQHSETVKEDITMVNDLYFSSPTPHPALSVISAKHINAIRVFALDDSAPNPSAERKVKRNVMLAQRQVERDMEGDFEDFQRSPLWFRVVGDTESNNAMTASVMSSSVVSDGGSSPFSTVRGRDFLDPKIRASRTNRSPIMINPPITARSESLPSLTAVSTEREALSPVRPIQSSLDLLMSSTENAADSSRAPLFDESEDAHVGLIDDAQAQRMEAIQAALTDIIAFDNEESSHPRAETPDEATSQRGSGFLSARRSDNRRKPSFDEEQDVEEERQDENGSTTQTTLPLAGPGDLQLAYEIARLGEKLINLRTQDTMLDRLINKADLTGDTQELRLLRKSKSALNREIRELSFQKTQYELQESANRLVSDRTKLAIVNSTVGEEGGKSVVRYIVEVQQLAIDGSFSTGWVVARRYNEFLQMHNRLRDKYALVRGLDFPGKRIVTGLSGHFVDTRRAALEKYMQVDRPS